MKTFIFVVIFCEKTIASDVGVATSSLPCGCKNEGIQQCSGIFEEYNGCGTACPLTCDNYKNPPEICTLQCVIGCECKEGYVRNEKTGSCCLPSECSACQPTCPLNEIYNVCGTACPITCNNYNNPPKFCTEQCVEGCGCKDGYVRNEVTGSCCLPCDCPCSATQSKCQLSHEVYSTCGTACPRTCENYRQKDLLCSLQCVEGCFCEPNYVRNIEGHCVLPSQCCELL